MIKLSLRLNLIASLVSNKNVIDVGCDHGLLSIFLYQNSHNVIASDISEKVLLKTKKNIKKYNCDIKTILSSGIDNIDIKKNTTVVIAGMGTNTILEILNNSKFKNVDEIIISSHNELEELRFKISKSFTIIEEKVILDKKYYVVFKLVNGKNKLTKKQCYIGFNNNIEYSNYLYDKNLIILSRIPKKYVFKRYKIKRKNKWLKDMVLDES